MNNLLIVFNHRIIPRCLSALTSLKYKKAWIQYYNETNACKRLNEIVMNTMFDNYILIADDVEPTQDTLDIVHSLSIQHNLVTGYCKLAQDSDYANVCRSPVTQKNGVFATWADYEFYHLDEIKQFQVSKFVSWFGGWCMTSIPRELLLEYPIKTINECQSDYNFSYQIGRKGLHFVSHKDAYIEHIKENKDRSLMSGNMVNKLIPRVIINGKISDNYPDIS